jgi:hypothetical protein
LDCQPGKKKRDAYLVGGAFAYTPENRTEENHSDRFLAKVGNKAD